ncbi:DNA polymerase III subunit epsilon [Alcaligenes faecalis]|jgi:DNA polymerase-3 subunit epsilon|uniref:DNA polymerase III subunit epsilon n=1 Tax=Alcaligenes TaxID=507 RepID=UPI0005F96CBA|nr:MULTISPECIES: DNA polymerase III subunit epsilon [Alcaligenes]ALO39368.1 DNA polymerase III subunit epsilon [Alcaligenes faecalis]ARP54852.1 DNA polymerase III subunit epsilon [Alcaligenes faecalis]MBQ0219106.1 DNA polymerase III subunit epsilon [Alcaligenes faecalis]MBW4787604.1 DNA polymerase III subunit epsilon [Alcaligenes faecalis subsp. faecalis]MBY6310725.1 DNA polymerase III subunit epsilon [Alcaligenes faecalis]
MRQIILDTETTGLEPREGHRIVEVGGVELFNRKLTGRHLHLYLNPDRDSDPEALAIHGLTTEFLSGHPRFKDVVDQVLDFVQGAEVIIHNASFDTRFLDAELQKVGKGPFSQYCDSITDSLLVAREMHPGKRNSLDALCERYGISNSHRTLHGALLDSELLADVWLAMTRGQDALLMDFDESDGQGGDGSNLSLGKFDTSVLKVLRASEADQAEHEKYMDVLEKQNKKPPMWREMLNPAAE